MIMLQNLVHGHDGIANSMFKSELFMSLLFSMTPTYTGLPNVDTSVVLRPPRQMGYIYHVRVGVFVRVCSCVRVCVRACGKKYASVEMFT